MTDQYGRTVVVTTNAETETYTVHGFNGEQFSVEVAGGTDPAKVMDTINSMSPPETPDQQ